MRWEPLLEACLHAPGDIHPLKTVSPSFLQRQDARIIVGLFYETEARKVFCEVELESGEGGPGRALALGVALLKLTADGLR